MDARWENGNHAIVARAFRRARLRENFEQLRLARFFDFRSAPSRPTPLKTQPAPENFSGIGARCEISR
jgi:hypothetical protein